MNTPMALRVLDADINETNSADVIASFGLLGIDFNFSYLQDEGIKHLVTERQAARQEGNFIKADEIRKCEEFGSKSKHTNTDVVSLKQVRAGH